MSISADPTPNRAALQRQTLTKAWLILGGFFGLSLLLVGLATNSAWRFYHDATLIKESRLIVRSVGTDGLNWRPCGRIPFQRASDQQLLRPCDAVRVSETVGYGQAATIELFDGSTLDLWAGATLALIEAQHSRWTNSRQSVVLEQSSGYVRYDLRSGQPFQAVRYEVIVGAARIELAPGGSYSIGFTPSERVNRVLDEQGRPMTISESVIDVAVRGGSARVIGVSGDPLRLVAGQRLQIDPTGMVGLPVPARWQLIRDGDFNRYSELAYNNTTLTDQPTVEQSQTWQVYGIGAASAANGYFRLAPSCTPPETGFACEPAERRTAAWFYRAGNQTSSFITGIQQGLGPEGRGVDVSEYRSLRLSGWVRILGQSLRLAGEQGTECPVMIRVFARRTAPADEPHERVLCIYSQIDPQAELTRWPGLNYQAVDPFLWHRIDLDLRAEGWFPDYRFLESIQVYASGHDYNAQVTALTLTGEQ